MDLLVSQNQYRSFVRRGATDIIDTNRTLSETSEIRFRGQRDKVDWYLWYIHHDESRVRGSHGTSG